MKRTTRNNLIFLLAVGAVIAALWLAGRAAPRRTGAVALVQYGDAGAEQRIPLAEDGGIRFVDSPCPDHLCEGFGVLRRAGDWAACLPARASVTILEE